MPRLTEEEPIKRPPYFWWLLANGLALCFAVLAWVFCLYVFGNPELPRNYAILKKLGRLPKLERYSALKVPDGNLYDPRRQYSSYINRDAEQLALLNSQLIRNYLTNYPRTLALTYIEGTYEVQAGRVLTEADYFPHGVVLSARAMVKPDEFTKALPYPVTIELVLPNAPPTVLEKCPPGFQLELRKSPHCCAILHVEKNAGEDEQIVHLTVTPIAYNNRYPLTDTIAFSVEPPEEVNPAAGLPVVKE